MNDKIVEILKDHELLRTDGVVIIKGIFPEVYDSLVFALSHLHSAGEEVYDKAKIAELYDDWMGTPNPPITDPDDPDYYEYNWGLNVWKAAFREALKLTLPVVTEGKVKKILLDLGHDDFEGYISDNSSDVIAKAIKELTKIKEG